MGREAQCQSTWAGESGVCKVLLEAGELIFRGAIRRRVPIASLTHIAVHDGQLRFRVHDDEVALTLAPALAQSWAKKLTTPPPSLASKLGIHPDSKILVMGEVESEELQAAIAQAGSRAGKAPELILVSVQTQAELDRALIRATSYAGNPPIWIIYRKGAQTELAEAAIRTTLRGQGFMDTKVASVSATHTALRFTRRGRTAENA
jgi:hypothetical protein